MNNFPILLLSFILICGTVVSQAQTIHPVTAGVVLVPPTSRYITDLTAPGSQKLMVNLMFNDFTVPSYQVALDVRVDGVGLSMSNPPTFTGQPITLTPGMNMLTGADIAEYFNPANMQIAGGDPVALRQSGALPEGMFNICVEVTDFKRRDVKLSNQACASLLVRRNEPPLAVFPNCGSTVPSPGIQNILFQWQRRHDPSIQAEYLLTIVPVPDGTSPDQAMQSTQTPILDKKVIPNMTSFNFGPSHVTLDKGKKYAYRIDVRDPLGQTSFENNGIGQVCSFQYGFGCCGTIALQEPVDKSLLKPNNKPLLKWGGPSNAQPGLEAFYRVTVTEMQPNQSPEDAFLNNSPWTVIETQVLTQLNQWSLLGDKDLPESKTFAWKVEAIARNAQGGQDEKIAESEVWSFEASPLIDHFTAADGRVRIEVRKGTAVATSTQGQYQLEGEGEVMLPNGKAPVKLNFKDIIVERRTGSNVLRTGEVVSKIEPQMDIPLTWEDPIKDNGEAKFVVDSVRISISTLFAVGQVNWTYPHPTTQGKGIVLSKSKQLEWRPTGIQDWVNLENTELELVDPLGFKVFMNDQSKIEIYNNEIKQTETKFHGKIFLPTRVKDVDENRIELPFENADNPFFFENQAVAEDVKDIRVFEKTKISIAPLSVTFDFSEKKSPDRKSSDLAWKGVYYHKFKLQLPKDNELDGSKQLVMKEETNMEFDLAVNEAEKAWVESSGLHLKLTKTWSGDAGPRAYFNTFIDNFREIKFDIENNSVTSSYIRGFISIPFFAKEGEFIYKVPVSDKGFQTAVLENFEDREAIFAEGQGDQEGKLKIKQAKFSDNDRLIMTVDLNWPNMGISFSDVPNLIVWGNGDAGFTKANGNAPVNNQQNGSLAGSFEVTAKYVWAGNIVGNYGIGFKGDISAGDASSGISGLGGSSDGVPLEIISIDPERWATKNAKSVTSDALSVIDMLDEIEGWVGAGDGGSGSITEYDWFSEGYLTKSPAGGATWKNIPIVIPIYLPTVGPVKRGFGALIFPVTPHPDYGRYFMGNLTVQLANPLGWTMKVGIILGKTNNVKYWSFEVGMDASPVALAEHQYEGKFDKIKDVFKPGGAFTTFRIMEEDAWSRQDDDVKYDDDGNPIAPKTQKNPLKSPEWEMWKGDMKEALGRSTTRDKQKGLREVEPYGLSKEMGEWRSSMNETKAIFTFGSVQITKVYGRIWHNMRKTTEGDCQLPDKPDAPDGKVDLSTFIDKVTPNSMGFVVDDNIDFGFNLRIGGQDAATQGYTVRADGELEMEFNSSGGLENIKLRAGAGFGNSDSDFEFGNAVSHATGCLAISTNPEFNLSAYLVGNLSKSPSICAGGSFRLLWNLKEIPNPHDPATNSGGVPRKVVFSKGSMSFDLGTEAIPLNFIVGCAGWKGEGWLHLDENNFGIGLGIGWGADVRTPEVDLKVCTAYARFKASAMIRGKVTGQYNPDFRMGELRAGVYLDGSLTVHISGAICPDEDFTLASVALNGSLGYNFITSSGTFDYNANISIAGFDFGLSGSANM